MYVCMYVCTQPSSKRTQKWEAINGVYITFLSKDAGWLVLLDILCFWGRNIYSLWDEGFFSSEVVVFLRWGHKLQLENFCNTRTVLTSYKSRKRTGKNTYIGYKHFCLTQRLTLEAGVKGAHFREALKFFCTHRVASRPQLMLVWEVRLYYMRQGTCWSFSVFVELSMVGIRTSQEDGYFCCFVASCHHRGELSIDQPIGSRSSERLGMVEWRTIHPKVSLLATQNQRPSK